jgi:hypothetical protein
MESLMKRLGFALVIVLSVVAFLGGVKPVAAGEQVPFQGRLDGDVTHAPVDPQTDAVLVEATGTATHLGQFAMISEHLVNTVARTAAGTFEFTAANGDKVYAQFTGQARPTATPGVLAIEETATITGGTGRFAGASGDFIVQRLYDRVAGTTTGSFRGNITSPGAAKR